MIMLIMGEQHFRDLWLSDKRKMTRVNLNPAENCKKLIFNSLTLTSKWPWHDPELVCDLFLI